MLPNLVRLGCADTPDDHHPSLGFLLGRLAGQPIVSTTVVGPPDHRREREAPRGYPTDPTGEFAEHAEWGFASPGTTHTGPIVVRTGGARPDTLTGTIPGTGDGADRIDRARSGGHRPTHPASGAVKTSANETPESDPRDQTESGK